MQTSITPKIKWSVDDYHRMIAAGILDDRKVELLAGEIYSVAPEGTPHTFRSISLLKRLTNALGNRAEVRDAHPIVLSTSEPEPDIAVVKGSFEDYADRHPCAADVLLVVEVAKTTLVKELNQKRLDYAADQIPENWVLNLNDAQLVVFRDPQDGDYQSKQSLKSGTISPLSFPDLSFSVWQLITGKSTAV